MTSPMSGDKIPKIDTASVVDTRDEGLSSPDGLQSESSSQFLDQLSLRESSSAFLAGLNSASDISSPMTSAFPSMDSLQHSRSATDNSDEAMSAGPSTHRDSMIEMVIPPKPQSTTDSRNDSPSSDTTTSTSKSAAMLTPLALTEPPPSPRPPPPTEHTTVEQHHHITPTNHDRTFRTQHVSAPPSRVPSPSHSAKLSAPGERRTRYEGHVPGYEYYSSGKHDEEYEQSHSRTPLLPPLDYLPPKETDQAVKDYSVLGNKLINQYETLAKLGSGAHGTVKLGRDKKNDRYVAIKVVRRYPLKPRLGKQEIPEDKVKKEVAVLKKAQHPHVVTLLEVIDDPRLEKVYLILEFVERGEIKWRKSADREIANFEMDRMKREMAGDNMNEAAETMRLLQFNEKLYQRYLDRLHAGSASASSSSSYQGGGDEYDDYTKHYRHSIRSRHSSRPTSRPASRPSSRPPSSFDELSSAVNTLRIPSRASSHRDVYSMDQELTGSIHGSCNDDEQQFVLASDFERERWLSDEPPLEQQWSPEEEEYRFVPCLTLSEARDVFRDTVLGLEYLHFHNIIHRDIKPANLLWTKDYRVKISDFGVSYLGRPLSEDDGENGTQASSGADVFSAELAKTVGTPAFYAPELCDPDLFDPEKNTHARPRIGPQIDVWALGITLYAMVYGRLAFWDQNEFTMYEKIARRELFVPAKRLRGIDYDEGVLTNSNKREEHVLMYEDVDEDLKDLIRRLLIKDPAKRISIKEVKHHPWLLRGVSNPGDWVAVTDPSAQTAEKIKVSPQDLQEAVVPRTFFSKVWNGITNMTRGRGPSRRRAETSGRNNALGKRISSSLSRTNTLNKDQRRSSLRGDEASIVDILRSTRDPTDTSAWHGATPTAETHEASFPPIQPVDSQGNLVARPAIKTATTADSVLTIRQRSKDELSYAGSDWTVPGSDSVGSSSSSLAKIVEGTKAATRRFTSKARSHDTKADDRMSVSSRASSGDNITISSDARSMKPSLAVSPALAAGHMELPPSLLEESAHPSHHLSPLSSGLASSDSLQSLDRGRPSRKRATTVNSAPWNKLSFTADEVQQRTKSRDYTGPSGMPHSHFLPLTASNIPRSQPGTLRGRKQSTPAYAATSDGAASLLTTGETITPAIMKQKEAEREEFRQRQSRQQQQQRQQNDRSFQPGLPSGQDATSGDGSDDEGIVMHGGKK